MDPLSLTALVHQVHACACLCGVVWRSGFNRWANRSVQRSTQNPFDPFTHTWDTPQKGNKAVEAVVGFIDRMDEAERELVRDSFTRAIVQSIALALTKAIHHHTTNNQECKRRDGTAFTSALRTLHLKVN